jgi:hypothetical protein
MTTKYRIWGDIPQNYKSIVDRNGSRLVVRADLEECITIPVFQEVDKTEEASAYLGRGRLRLVRFKSGETGVIRAYRHGGWFRKITGEAFFTWPPRPFRELTITEELRCRGIPTVEVYGACVAPIWGPMYRGWLITRELAGAQNLWAVLQSGLFQELKPGRVLRAVAESIYALHREGVYHSDLNLKNILIREESTVVKAYIIDFDKAKLFLGKLPPAMVKTNFDRLFRSARKLDPDGRSFSPCYRNELINLYREIDRCEV